jgi:cell wall assembly regulator SMI1
MSTLKDWKRFSKWLEKSAPSLAASLLPGVDAVELAAFEKEVGATLPASVRELWSACGGQKELDGPGVVGDFVLLSPRTALAAWRLWAELRSESSEEAREELASACSSHPPGAIREEYSVAGWIPLWKERMEGNFLGVDVDPGAKGVVGQVIGFGRDEDDKRVLFWDYAATLAWLADQADDGALSLADDVLEHRDGRILSVLTSLAEDGALPPGRSQRPHVPSSRSASRRKRKQRRLRLRPCPIDCPSPRRPRSTSTSGSCSTPSAAMPRSCRSAKPCRNSARTIPPNPWGR